ncbi:MAG: glycosyltransferase [Desulfamplus sp.]|nr:glycosyltransferase [Desulfamplus sp.]
MKIAIVHDYLCGKGGSERIFQYICEEFPEADAYALAFNPDQSYPYFSKRKIQTTWLNRFVQSMDVFRKSFPIATYAMQMLDFSQYDIVLSSSATVGKYINVPSKKHICYCYIPTRAIWHFDKYFNKKGFKVKLFKLLLPYLKKRDYKVAQSVWKFIAISEDSKGYIKKYYNKNADIINCPINLENFYSSENKKEHYLIVSRLEHWKRVDYAIEAFNKLGLPLKVIGVGLEKERLQNMAKSNISFLGSVDDRTLAKEYSEAKAVIFTPFLEYGLIPLEANASGTPVICYGKGGVTEIMISTDDLRAEQTPPTAVFFYNQTSDALIEAIKKFESVEFNSDDLVNHANKFSIPAFKQKIRKYIEESALL